MCSVCSQLVHASCDPLLTDSVLKAITTDAFSRIRYICADCLPFLETLRRMRSADQDSSTCAMDNSVLSFQTVPSSALDDVPIELIDAPISVSKRDHANVTQRLNVIEEKLEMLSKAIIPSPRNTEPAPTSYSDALAKGIPRTNVKNESKNIKAPNLEALTLICSNIPESDSPSLRERQEADKKSWSELCSVLEVNIHPVQLTRLSRPPKSPHAGEPRLLRVLLKNESDVETVLLAAFKLRLAKSVIRIYPDIPWRDRQLRKEDHKKDTRIDDFRAVFVHGVPELNDTDELKNKQHDCSEWRYIKELLGTDNIITTRLSRLPHSTNYKGTGPRILKVCLNSEQMVSSLLSSWYQHRRNAPPDLRIRGFLRRKAERDASVPTAASVVLDNATNSQPLTVASKNLLRPVQ